MPTGLRTTYKPPEAAIFGAGISGLTVAHELVERGFTVHVIEPAESPTEEYACQIGGMAANQLGRVPFLEPTLADEFSRRASIAALKKTLPPEETADIRAILAELIPLILARLQMEPIQKRYAITEHIQFNKSESKLRITDQEISISVDLQHQCEWRTIKDFQGITNQTKLDSVFGKIFNMYTEYRNELDRVLGELFSEPQLRNLSAEKKERVRFSLEPYIFLVRIIGYTDTDGLPEVNRKTSEIWARWVGDTLVEINNDRIPQLDRFLICLGGGTENPLGEQSNSVDRERSNRVEFSIIGQVIPGEHGYRFFPGFYRHLFDTMKRTPVFNESGDLTPETAYDQLVATPDSAVGFSRTPGVIPVKLRRFTSIKDLQKTIEFFREKANFTPRDLLRLQTHFLKYMTSCKKRRSQETEDISFWEYIHANKVSYSPSAARFVESAPQALVAMSAQETDARTQYNSLIQMLVENPLEPFAPDMTLNGTTSEAWLDRWKNYLKRKGVRFYTGSLKGFAVRQGADGRDELIPVVAGPDIHPHRPLPEINVKKKELQTRAAFNAENPDFFVMALPFEKASKMVWETYLNPAVTRQRSKFCGPFMQLIEFDIMTRRRLPDGTQIPRHRDPCTGLPKNKADPLRDISGIQYFLPNTYRFVEGHVYYPDSPWALTSISQYAFFRDRAELTGSYIGQQSFDIGDWYETDPTDDGATAWNSTRQELAERTWAQALATLDPEYARSLMKPKYYHLDDGIRFCVGPELNESRDSMTTIAAFRGNAVVRISGVAEGKIYTLKLCGNDDEELTSIEVVAEVGDKEVDVCRKFVSKINGEKSLAAAIFDAPNRIVLSPTAACHNAVRIKTNGQSAKPAVIFVNGAEFTLQAADNQKLQSAGNHHVARRGEDGTITVHCKRVPEKHRGFSVAVCNADNCVELLGGPRLRVELHAPVENGRSLAEIPREALEHAVVLYNENPYIINVPGQWRHRPGFKQTTGKIDYAIENEAFEDCLFRRWVPAGTFMATYTRLTTMEAANESGRHAVNAILQALKAVPIENGKEPLFNGQGKLYGDPCRIWDPEDNELADLNTLKELDEALMREGLPHILDIFRVSEFLESLPDNVSLGEADNRIRALIDGSARASLIGLKALDSTARACFDAIAALWSGR